MGLIMTDLGEISLPFINWWSRSLTKRKERINLNQNIPLKSVLLLLACSLCFYSTRAQFYLRGEVREEKNGPLPNVKLLLHSSGYLYHSGSSGDFGIPIPQPFDTLTLSADGYQTLIIRVSASQYQDLRLKPVTAPPAAVAGVGFRMTCLLAGASPWRGSTEASAARSWN